MSSSVADNIRRLMEERGYNPASLSAAAGKSPTYVRDILEGRVQNPRGDGLADLARALGCDIADLLGMKRAKDISAPTSNGVSARRNGGFAIEELDVVAAAGPGSMSDEPTHVVRDQWQIPGDVMRSRTNSSAEEIKIIRVIGDSMSPTLRPGDRVMVDMLDRLPSPPGLFAVWDGYGLVLKRVEIIFRSEPPRVLLKSDNPAYESYERELEDVHIHGRVIGNWEWR